MVFLALVGVHALIFRPLVYNNTAAIDRAPKLPGVAKLAGGLSLLLWLSVMTMGRLIGYYEGPKRPVVADSRPAVTAQFAAVDRASR
jgi:hypothetical protein